MIIKENPTLSIRKQCRFLGVNRSNIYYTPKGENESNLSLMRLMDEEFLKHPFYGSRKMVFFLRRKGYNVGRHRVRRLMRLMGLCAIYQKPNTSKKNHTHKVYPYLLSTLCITKPNQVWATDITYLPMKQGFMYLVAIMDWYSRKILAWRLSNTMDIGFCLEALEEAFQQYGTPEIFNSDQGSHFTSLEFTEALQKKNVQISMDSKGRWMDNVMIERLWRSLKYECIYVQEFENTLDLKCSLKYWINYYNQERPHATFNGQTPKEVYDQHVPQLTNLAA